MDLERGPATDSSVGASFAGDGFAIFRQAVPLTELQAIFDDFEARLALREAWLGMGEAPRSAGAELDARAKILGRRLIALEEAAPGEQGLLYDAMGNSPALHRCAANPELLAIIRSLLSPVVAVHSRLILLMSLPERNWHLSAWHQDHFYNGGPDSSLTVWAPLQRTDETNGSLLLARGEHRGGKRAHGEHDHGFQTKWLSLDPQAVAGFDDVVAIEAEPGDIVVFNSLAPHSARVNRSQDVRFTVNLRYQDLTDPDFTSQGWRVGELAQARNALGRTQPLIENPA